jgi:hypothetical protein
MQNKATVVSKGLFFQQFSFSSFLLASFPNHQNHLAFTIQSRTKLHYIIIVKERILLPYTGHKKKSRNTTTVKSNVTRGTSRVRTVIAVHRDGTSAVANRVIGRSGEFVQGDRTQSWMSMVMSLMTNAAILGGSCLSQSRKQVATFPTHYCLLSERNILQSPDSNNHNVRRRHQRRQSPIFKTGHRGRIDLG